MTASLDGVLQHLEILRVLLAPTGLDLPVGGVVVYDPVTAPRLESGDLVLGVGVSIGRQESVDLIRAAGAAGAAAVVLKLGTDTPPDLVMTAAREEAVALLVVDREAAWGQLYTLLRTALEGLGVADAAGPDRGAVGDLFTLVNAVAAMVGGAATIEGPDSTVLAYSSLDEPIDEPRRATILGRRVPPDWLDRLQEDGVFNKLWGGDEVVRIAYAEPSGFQTRLAIAVRAGGQILGSIWVAEGRKPLGPQAEAALREAARIAALHLVRHHLGEDLERRHGSELLRAVFDGRRPPDLLTELLGPAGHHSLTIIGFELRDADSADLAVRGERMVSLIDLYAQAYRHQAVCTRIGRVVYMMVTELAARDPERLTRLATAIAAQAQESLQLGIHAGIGSTVETVGAVPASRQEADLVLRALGVGRGRPLTVATIDDVSSAVVLLRLRDLVAEEPSLLAGKVDLLARLDAKGHTCYRRTLRAYLDALGDIPAAAASLGVHPNTYRYRLRRLMTLLDFADPVERLILHLQLHLQSAAADPGDEP